LEIEFKRLGQLIVSVGLLIAKQCDAYVKSCCPDYSDNKIARTIEQSLCCKARLLHYFPQANENIDRETEFSSWCGWVQMLFALILLFKILFLFPVA
jgi:hypothetical protein